MTPQSEILHQIEKWFSALQTNNSDKVAELYAEDAVLVPTLWDGPCNGRDAIRNYFSVVFLPKCPTGYLINYFIHVAGDFAINSGHYFFTMYTCDTDSDKSATGSRVGDKATGTSGRFTFVYKKDSNDAWKIVAHHSSIMPEQVAVAEKERLKLDLLV
jgi:uncharacterized protein (TIGR02246 family)